ncbi:hypothetical protein HQQ80_12620 [Microbacteriaceae bacterium VKM Ac-2855]|nr:hypothetical protein [Microbacteriaceae bacterium VKM Ac-2855]
MHTTNYVDTFIAVADDTAALEAIEPPARARPSVAELTHRMIAEHPYHYTSDDVIFTVWADRNGIAEEDRAAQREQFFSTGRACLRSSDVAKRYGWGVHADSDSRVALVAMDSPEYAIFLAGATPKGAPITVTKAMRSARR